MIAELLGRALPSLGLGAGWRAQLRPASFRGIAFRYSDTTAESGQRFANHDYPQRDGRWHEALGELPDSFTIEALLIGSDLGAGLFAARDQLVKACRRGEPGELVHPYAGQRKCVCMGVSERYSSAEGGVIRLSLKFEVDRGNTYPTTQADPLAQLASSIATARLAVKGALAAAWAITHWRQFLADFAVGFLGGLMGRVLDVGGLISPAALAAVRDVMTVSAITASLVRDGAAIASLVGDGFGALTVNDDGTPRDFDDDQRRRSIDALSAFDASHDLVPGTGSSHLELEGAINALSATASRLALISEVELAAGRTFDSANQARSYRDDLAGRLDEAMLVAGDRGEHEVAGALAVLRATIVTRLVEAGASLRPVVSLTPSRTLPAMALAHQLYAGERGALRLAADLVVRNGVRHPGFVPGGAPIEALAPLELRT